MGCIRFCFLGVRAYRRSPPCLLVAGNEAAPFAGVFDMEKRGLME